MTPVVVLPAQRARVDMRAGMVQWFGSWTSAWEMQVQIPTSPQATWMALSRSLLLSLADLAGLV